jgi:hypothetical protein
VFENPDRNQPSIGSCRREEKRARVSEPVSIANPAGLFTNGGDGANGASARDDANGGATDGARDDANANAPRWSAASHPLAPLQQRLD